MAVEAETGFEAQRIARAQANRLHFGLGQERRGNALAVTGRGPLSEMFGYATDLRSNTQRVFVPREALTSVTVLAVVGATNRRRKGGAPDTRQVTLFEQ